MNIKQTYQLDASQASKSLAQLKLSIGQLNQTLAKNRQQQMAANQQITNAANRLLNLNSVQSRVHSETKRGISFFGLYGDSIRSVVGQVFIATAAHRTFLRTIQGVIEGIGEAQKFDLKVREIQTLSLETADATSKWKRELEELSVSFGLDNLDLASAAYQTLSNQVRRFNGETIAASQVQQFLREEVKLATIGVSSLNDAVNATTAILNAYGLAATQADNVNAIFFATIDRGRLRLDEIANGIGQVAILSSQLGVGFDQQNAAIALLTRRGISAAEAMTLLRNVELKLIKPTEEMQGIFDAWGVSSGKAAIEAFGFGGVLERLFEQAESSSDAMSEMAQMFGRVRAIVGSLGLKQADYNKELELLRESATKAGQAMDVSMSGAGKRSQIQLQKLSVEFNRAGERALEMLTSFAESFGGADVLLRTAVHRVFRLTQAFVAFKAAIWGVTTAQAAMNGETKVGLALQLAGAGRYRAAAGAMLGFQSALSVTSLAVGALTGGLAYLAFEMLAARERSSALGIELQALAQKVTTTVSDRLQKNFEGMADRLATPFEEAGKRVEQYSAGVSRMIAESQAMANALDENFDKASKTIQSKIDSVFRDVSQTAQKEVQALQRDAERLQNAVDSSRQNIASRRVSEFVRGAGVAAEGQNPEQQLRALAQLRNTLFSKATDALNRGNRGLADQLFEEATAAQDRLIDRQKELAGEIADASESTFEGQQNAMNAMIEQQRRAQTQTIRDLDKELQGLGNQRGRLIQKNQTGPELTAVNRQIDDLLKKRATLLTVESRATQATRLAQQRVVQFEEQRKLLVEQRIKKEEEFNARQLAIAASKEAAAKKQEMAYQRLTAVLSQLDAARQAGGVNDFDKLLGQAGGLADQAGLGGAERLNIFRDLLNQRRLMVRESAMTEANTRLEAMRLALNREKELLKKGLQERADINRDRVDSVSNLISGGQGQLGFLQELGNRLRTDGYKAAFSKDVLNSKSEKGVEEFRLAVSESKALLGQIENAQKEGKPIEALVNQFQESMKLVDALQVKLGTLIGAGALKDDQGMRVRSLNFGDNSTDAAIKNIGQLTEKLQQNFKATEESNKNLTSMDKSILGLKKNFEDLPDRVKEFGDGGAAATKTFAEGLEELRRQTAFLTRELQEAKLAFPGAAAPPGLAMGGSTYGSDTISARLNRNEMVMNPSAVSAYGPLLASMNAASRGSRGGGDSYTFGDIHLHSVDTNVDVEQIAQALERRMRLGRSGRQ